MTVTREKAFMRYRADTAALEELLEFLTPSAAPENKVVGCSSCTTARAR